MWFGTGVGVAGVRELCRTEELGEGLAVWVVGLVVGGRWVVSSFVGGVCFGLSFVVVLWLVSVESVSLVGFVGEWVLVCVQP